MVGTINLLEGEQWVGFYNTGEYYSLLFCCYRSLDLLHVHLTRQPGKNQCYNPFPSSPHHQEYNRMAIQDLP
jgi:hypothetical protein